MNNSTGNIPLHLMDDEDLQALKEISEKYDLLPSALQRSLKGSPKAPKKVSTFEQAQAMDFYSKHRKHLYKLLGGRDTLLDDPHGYLRAAVVFAILYNSSGNIAYAWVNSDMEQYASHETPEAIVRTPEVRYTMDQYFMDTKASQMESNLKLLNELFGLMEVDVTQLVEWRDGNYYLKDSDSLNTLQRKAIRKVTTDPKGRVQVELMDRGKLMEKAMEVTGILKRNSVTVTTEDNSEEHMSDLMAKIAEREGLTKFLHKEVEKSIEEGRAHDELGVHDSPRAGSAAELERIRERAREAVSAVETDRTITADEQLRQGIRDPRKD